MNIEVARKSKSMTRKELCEWLEIPPKTLEKWEQGARKCPVYVEKLIIDKILSRK